MQRITTLLLALCFVSGALLTGCTSNAEKIGQFCTEWRGAVDSNKDDCDKMGAALKGVVEKYEDVKLYGRTDDEGSQKATEECQAAIEPLLKCVDNPSVAEAMELLEVQN